MVEPKTSLGALEMVFIFPAGYQDVSSGVHHVVTV
jgi:hypothetical protein